MPETSHPNAQLYWNTAVTEGLHIYYCPNDDTPGFDENGIMIHGQRDSYIGYGHVRHGGWILSHQEMLENGEVIDDLHYGFDGDENLIRADLGLPPLEE